MKIVKYENIEHELTNLDDVLKKSLQDDVLEIKKLVKSCDKFKDASKNISNLDDAEYVIYSKYMSKDVHEFEFFIFIDKTGKNVSFASGLELELYDMIEECNNLVKTKEFEYKNKLA